jgi:hypothetical protein
MVVFIRTSLFASGGIWWHMVAYGGCITGPLQFKSEGSDPGDKSDAVFLESLRSLAATKSRKIAAAEAGGVIKAKDVGKLTLRDADVAKVCN